MGSGVYTQTSDHFRSEASIENPSNPLYIKAFRLGRKWSEEILEQVDVT